MGVKLVAVLTLLLLAGCSSKANPVFHVDAAKPMVMAAPATPGFGYDGTGMVEATGTLTIHAMNADNSGYVAVDVTVPSGPMKGHYQVNWTKFQIQPNQAWQDGGIACGPGLVEHGASGHGNKMEPQFDLDCGGWGMASGSRDGQALVDPVTGASTFNAHVMVTKEAMLQAGGKVFKSDKKTPFDPHNAGDGYVDPSRMEAHFALWGAGAYKDSIAVTPPQASTTYLNDTATGAVPPAPSYTKTLAVAIPGGSAAHLHLGLGAAPNGPGQVSLTLLDPSGQPVDGFTASSAQPTRDADITKTLTAGNYTMRVDGQGAMTAYSASILVQPPTPFLLHVVFRDVHVE